MAGAIAAELAVLFRADTSALEKGLARAQQDIKATGDAANKGGGMIGGLIGGLGKLGLAGMGIGAIKGAVSGVVGSFGDMIGAAESTTDAYARLESVLGAKGMDAVSDAAIENANALGLSNQAFAEAAGAASNYLVNLGLSKDAATSMSIGMTELAPKLAAFANMDPSAVTDALQKGVGGSTRGLKELGIAINDDLLKGLDDASKSAEIFRQIQEQSGPASAAWADNQGDVANSMARVSAAMDDAKAAIGERLLPIIAPLVAWFADKLPGAIDMVIQAGGAFIANVQAVWDKLTGFFGDASGKGESFRDKLVEVWNAIKEAVGKVVDWFNTNVKPILVGIFETVAAKVATLKQQFDEHFGGIRGAVAAVVEWFKTNVAPTLASVFDQVMAVVGPVVAFIRDHMDQIKAVVGGAIDMMVGAVKVGFNLLKGIFETVMALIRGDWSGAWEAIKGTVANIIPGIKQVLGGLFTYLGGLGKIALDAALSIGGSIVDGIKQGIQSKWDAVTAWVSAQINKIPLGIRKLLGIASPSKIMAEIGENVVEGLRQGMAGLADLAGIVNETLGRIIGDADRENFKSIAELTGSLLDIFKNTTDAIKALLSFDITTSAEQISAQFDALVGTFETALLRMKGLAQYAGRGESPLNFLNMFDVQNIEIVSRGFDATISLIDGVLDIAAKLQTVRVPNAADIEALFEPLSKLGDVAARFIKSVGSPEGEDATAYFEQGATTTAALASWAKSIADVVGLKFDTVAADFAAQMTAAATAAGQAVEAVKAMALHWGGMLSQDRDKLLQGLQSFAAAVGSAAGALKAVADLKIDAKLLATADQMTAAANASRDAVASIALVAKAWVDDVGEWAAKAVVGIKAYADAAGAAVSLLGNAGGLDLSKAVAATAEQLEAAAKSSHDALVAVAEFAKEWIKGEEWAAKAVAGIKAFSEAAGAALDVLVKGAAGMNALGEVKRLAGIQPRLIRTILEQLRNVVAIVTDPKNAIKAPTEAQAAALKALGDVGGVFDGLSKAAAGMNELGQIKQLRGVQPRMIRTLLEQLAVVVAVVTDPKTALKPITSDQAAAIKAIGDSSGVLSSLAGVADGFAKLSGKLTIPTDLPTRVLALVEAMRTVVAGITGAMTGDGAIDLKSALAGADLADAVKRIGESMGPIFDAINGALESPFGKIKAKGAKGDTWRANIAERIKGAIVAAVTALNDALASMPTINVPDALMTGVERLATVYDRILDILGKLDGVKIDARALTALAAVPGILAGGLTAANVSGSGGTLTLVGGATGGGITINNTVTPTFMPMQTTINNDVTVPISVSGRVIDTISSEVANILNIDVKLNPAGP